MGFYSAAVAFSSIGAPATVKPWEVTGALELSYLPRLSRAERSAGFDKPESSNLSPVIPRPRVGIALPGSLSVELSWLPPVRVFGAKANLFSLAVARPIEAGRGLLVTPRVAGTDGRVRGAITCNDDLVTGTESEGIYFRAVCGNRESDDYFEPGQLSAELLVSRKHQSLGFDPYLGGGVRRDDVRFDVGVVNSDGTRNPDHPVLTMRATRAFVVGGASLGDANGRRVAAEVYYAPGSLVTARVRGEFRIRKGK